MIVYLLIVVLGKDVKVTAYRNADACIVAAGQTTKYDQRECVKREVEEYYNSTR